MALDKCSGKELRLFLAVITMLCSQPIGTVVNSAKSSTMMTVTLFTSENGSSDNDF